jgi:photosystem II stability/assembly factor-like uncharacterized protein
MNAKYYILFLFAGLINIQIARAQWHLETCPVKENLNAVFLTDLNKGWIVGDHGTIVSLMGNKWMEYQSPTKEHLYSVIMINDHQGWALGAKGTILHYNGSNWESYESPTSKTLYAVSFKDANNGMAVGAMGVIIKYENGRWTLLSNKTRGDLYSISYVNNDSWIGGVGEGSNIPIMKTSFGTDLDFFVNYSSIKSMVVLNDHNGWAVGARNMILQYNGTGWQRYRLNEEIPALRSVFFVDENRGISAGYSGTILTYSDNKWNRQKPITNQHLNATYIVKDNCYVVGDSGTIISNNPLYKNSPAEISTKNQDGFNISLFPNPCDSYMELSYSVEKDNSSVFLTINNLGGQIIKAMNLTSNAGDHVLQLSTGDIESGTYIINLTIDNAIDKSKLIIQH